AVIFENQNIFKPAVFFQVKNAVAKGPQDIFNSFCRKCRQCGAVVRGFNDDLMRADAVHLVEHAFSLTAETAFNSECKELVRNNAQSPSRRVALRWGTAIWARTIGLNFRWGLGFIAIAERTESTLYLDAFPQEITRTLGPVGRDNDPAAHNRVFS